MKKIIIIGAGFLQTFIIRKAKEMGYYTIAIDKNSSSIGFKFADEYAVIDIIDQEACLKYAQSKHTDGVMTAATDYGVLSTAYVAKHLNLPGINYEVAKIIKNKYKVRRVLSEKKVDDVSQYYEVSDINELEQISEKICFPVMVKPCDGSGSKAVQRVDTVKQLKGACSEAINVSLINRAVIEEFVEGTEYGVESFVYDGQVHVLGVMSKYMTNPPDYAELGHSMPSKLVIEGKVKEAAEYAIKALGINFGAVNMDVLVTRNERICIIDIGARMGGNLIGTHIIPLGTGIDYIENLIRATVRDSVDISSKTRGINISTRLLALKPGEIEGLPNFDEIRRKYKVDIYHHLEIGGSIKEYHNNLDGCGYVVAIDEDINEADRRAEEVKQLIDDGVKRKVPEAIQ